ncbi:MAG: hypothetical protein KUG58_11065 [Marinosulfonomonas sp.]|nr:hypothetical protein [Marinosulfonomonas sp.]
MLLSDIAYMIFPLVIVLFIDVVYVQKWNRFDLGFRMPHAWPMVIIATLLFALAGLAPYLFGMTTGLTWTLIAFAAY